MQTIIGGKELIHKAAQLLKDGEVVAFPTETVYGLGANALNKSAVEKIFIAKGRPQDNPLIVHISSFDQLDMVAKNIPSIAYELWEKFSPGPLTLVLEKQDNVPQVTTSGLDTVGIRIPDNPIALELISYSNMPLAAPSANTSGRLSPTTALSVFEDMNGKIPLILDGGPSRVGIESTVLDLTKFPYKVLRPGAITVEMLVDILGRVENHKGEVVVANSPGMKYKHYAPKCKCVSAINIVAAKKHYDDLIKKGYKRPIIIGTSKFIEGCKDLNFAILGNTPEECMQNFFELLRKIEKECDYIILQNFDKDNSYYALSNRISKATEGLVIF